MPVSRSLLVAIGLVALASALPADASKTRLRLERVDAGSFASDGTVRVFASVVELEGNVDDDRTAPQFTLEMDGKRIGKPIKAVPFSGSGAPLDLVLVVESSALYGPQQMTLPPPLPPPPPRGKHAHDPKRSRKITAAQLKQLAAPGAEPLDKVKDAVHALLDGLSPKVRVLLIDYGGDATPHPPFRPAQAVAGDVDDLLPDGEAGDLSLVQAVEEALHALSKPRPDGLPARRLVVVISDGLNSQMDRHTFRALGNAAAKAHVPIHTIAFSPTDERGPLLNLGEISKRSNGTFRWARTADDLRAQIDTLTDELNQQYVLTFKIDARSLEKRRFRLISGELTSNVLLYDSAGGVLDEVPATRPLLPWWLWGLLGVVLFGGAAAILIARRPKKKFSPYKSAVRHQPSAISPGGATQNAAPGASHAQTSSGHVQTPQANVAAATRGVLIIVSGARAGQRVDVGAQPVTIGKAGTIPIADDPTVSTSHAEVALRGGAFVVTDLGSTNGTFVNSQRIAQPTRLSDGDLLRFGNTQMKFRIG